MRAPSENAYLILLNLVVETCGQSFYIFVLDDMYWVCRHPKVWVRPSIRALHKQVRNGCHCLTRRWVRPSLAMMIFQQSLLSTLALLCLHGQCLEWPRWWRKSNICVLMFGARFWMFDCHGTAASVMNGIHQRVSLHSTGIKHKVSVGHMLGVNLLTQ